MDLEFIMELKNAPAWKILRREILSKEFPKYRNKFQSLNSYQLVHVLVGENGQPIIEKQNENDTDSYLVFTEPTLATRLERVLKKEEVEERSIKLQAPQRNLKLMMLGHLIEKLKDAGAGTTVKVNPLYVEAGEGMKPFLYAEEVLFAPQFDEVTQKYLLSDPDDAKALLAIRPEDEKRFGIEIIYYLITTRGLPEDQEEKENFLRDRIEELAFMAPRVPIRRGSGSFLGILLNLENDLEERAFIRDYPMFDEYSDSIFVTSQLKILSGTLEEIHYNGDQIDTIFGPLIRWQKLADQN
ncbi:MAG: hypothetical protein CME63_02825 [Halobacteriovoraceae bacterium]|nr:hypothetical protein [Halobacteriovoraceae bacterium]|tara:strand:+ start:24193 stop:25086 length:894 start_codon:yes stop_codon:yes gene_type:complete